MIRWDQEIRWDQLEPYGRLRSGWDQRDQVQSGGIRWDHVTMYATRWDQGIRWDQNVWSSKKVGGLRVGKAQQESRPKKVGGLRVDPTADP